MKITEFREEIINELKETLVNGYEVEPRDVTKNNGVQLCGISISASGDRVTPSIYLESLFNGYEKGEMSVHEAAEEIIRVYEANKVDEAQSRDFSFVQDFDVVKDKIVFRLVNAERNKDLLKKIPHREFFDLAVIYSIFLKDVFSHSGNILITNDFMERWGATEDDLYRLALENAPRLKAPKVIGLMDVVREAIDIPCGTMDGDLDINMMVVTSGDRFYGDATVLYPGLLESVAEKMGCDLYLLPSSVHEFIIVPAEGNLVDAGQLMELVRSVNATAVSNEDFLSDSVYLYNREEREISIA